MDETLLKEQEYDKKPQLLMYYTSARKTEDQKNSVSYASILFP